MPKRPRIDQDHSDLLFELEETYGLEALLLHLAAYHLDVAKGTRKEASFKFGRKRQMWIGIAKVDERGAEILKKAAARVKACGVAPAPLILKKK